MAASASAGAGGKYVDLSGVYELDRDASDKISIFLKEAGFSWATRSMADMMGLTLTVQHTEDGFTGTGKTSVGTGTYVLEVGKACPYDMGGSIMMLTSKHTEDGRFESVGALPNDKDRKVIMYHGKGGEDNPDGLLVMTHVHDKEGKETHVIKRVLRAKAK